LIPALLAGALAALVVPAQAGAVTYPDGVASGDVTSKRAILWTRVDQSNQYVRLSVFRDSALRKRVFFWAKKSNAARDNTIKIDAYLKPDTQYWYRFATKKPTAPWWHWEDWHPSSFDFSPVGTFVTAPKAHKTKDVKFTWSGDSDAHKVAGNNPFNNWETLSAAQAENGKFFVYNGDTIYSDSSNRPGGPATTLADYRNEYRLQRGYSNLTNLLASTSTYAFMDDHEVQNDYDGQTVDPARYAAGRQAFLENMPVRTTDLPHDPSCAGDPLYRTFKWGTQVELFVLDQRSCRSADVEATCSGDRGPTVPLSIRQMSPFTLFFPLPGDAVPPGCLDAIFDPSRTMLGPVQKEEFLEDLEESTAKHKIVLSELAFQQFHVQPYDRWEGYGAERNEILNFIRDNGISNVTFLTTDNHMTSQNQVAIDTFADPQPIANETITGPIATNTFQREVIGVAGLIGLFAVNQIMNLDNIDCRHLDKYSYGLVDVNAAAGTATVSSRDSAGAVITNQNPPGNPCTMVSGP
jgi:phosphodiesterase/alkaline phosphatase D-like protein